MSDVSNIGGSQAASAAYTPINIAPAASGGVPATTDQASAPIGNASVPTGYGSAPQAGATTNSGVSGGGAPAATNQQYVQTNPATAAGATQQAPAGPPAWNMEWSKKFLDAGLPAESVQQLTMTGANGADAAQLQASLDEVLKAGDAEIKKFAAEHGDEYVDLKAAKGLKRADLLAVAMQANQGTLKDQGLKDAVSQLRTKNDPFNMLKSFLPWSFIPAWGAVRVALSPLFGGHDPISGERIKLDFWNNGMAGWIDALGAVAGAVTISSYAKSVGSVVAGQNALATSEAAKAVAAGAGMTNLKGVDKLLSFLPGTSQNRVISGLRTVAELEKGVQSLATGSVARELAEKALKDVVKGDLNMWGATPQKVTLFGFQSNTRSTLMSRGKQMVESLFKGNKATLITDARGTGSATAAHVASAMVDTADAATRAKIIASLPAELQAQLAAGGIKDVKALLRGQVLGQASQQLVDAGTLTQKTGLGSKLWSYIRPGAVEDSFKAIDLLGTARVGESQGLMTAFKNLGGLGKVGIVGGIAAAAAGGIYFLGVKPQLEAQKTAEAQAAAAGGGAAPTGDAEAQAYLQQFAAATPQEQQAELQSLGTAIQQAQAAQGTTAEQQDALQVAITQYQQMATIAQGGGQQAAAQPQAGARQQVAAPAA